MLTGGASNQTKICHKKKYRTQGTIVLSIDTLLLYIISDLQDPVAVGTKLVNQFEKKNLGSPIAPTS